MPAESNPAWREIFAEALDWRLQEREAPDDEWLGTAAMVAATHRLARPLMPALSARALRIEPAERRTRQGRMVDAVEGALAWVRLVGADA